MSRRNLTIKNHQKEVKLFAHRCITIMVMTFIFTGCIIARLYYLQVIQHNFYSTLSQQNLLTIIPIEPERGLIYDRNGLLLAKNIPTYNLVLTPARISNMKSMITQLRKVMDISDKDIKLFQHKRTQYRPYQPVPLKLNLSEFELAKFYVDQYRFPGAAIQTKMMRYYPYSDIYNNVIGYVGRINQKELNKIDPINYSASDYIGKMGIEKSYEEKLHGTVGDEQAETDATGRIVRVLKRNPPIPGENIYLTIDSELQKAAIDALGEESGAVAAIDPKSGEVLALVTRPGFDPNLFVKGITQAEYKNLMNDPQHPLYNRDIRGLFAPGSTIKPFMAISGLDKGVINKNFTIWDPGHFQLPHSSHLFRDWRPLGHGSVNVSKAITQSCDVFFYTVAMMLGINRIDEELAKFGFGQATKLDIPNELSGLLPSPDWKRGSKGMVWFPGDTVQTGIGQGFTLITPIQLAQAATIIANRGLTYQPHLLLKSQTPEGKFNAIHYPAQQALTLKNPKIWDIVIEAMVGVIKSPFGTAHAFGNNAPYTAAGKTGTAQVYRSEDNSKQTNSTPKLLRNNHLFISFAPVEDPQIVMAVLLEHAHGADGIARKVMDKFFHVEPPPPPPIANTQPTANGANPNQPNIAQPNNQATPIANSNPQKSVKQTNHSNFESNRSNARDD